MMTVNVKNQASSLRDLPHFMKLNIVAANHCENALTQFQELLQSEYKSDLFRLKSFNRKEHRLDELFFIVWVFRSTKIFLM